MKHPTLKSPVRRNLLAMVRFRTLGRRWCKMNFKDDEELLPTGEGGFEKAQLKRDEKLKSF